MAKFSLASAPKTFKRIVKITLLDETTEEIEITFKYKTRSEYAKLLDEVIKTEKSSDKAEQETASEIFKRLGAGTADFLMKIIDAWDLPDALNKSSLATLIDCFPSAANEITETYRVAILEGRTKN